MALRASHTVMARRAAVVTVQPVPAVARTACAKAADGWRGRGRRRDERVQFRRASHTVMARCAAVVTMQSVPTVAGTALTKTLGRRGSKDVDTRCACGAVVADVATAVPLLTVPTVARAARTRTLRRRPCRPSRGNRWRWRRCNDRSARCREGVGTRRAGGSLMTRSAAVVAVFPVPAVTRTARAQALHGARHRHRRVRSWVSNRVHERSWRCDVGRRRRRWASGEIRGGGPERRSGRVPRWWGRRCEAWCSSDRCRCGRVHRRGTGRPCESAWSVRLPLECHCELASSTQGT
jgi:hypothetical protein